MSLLTILTPHTFAPAFTPCWDLGGSADAGENWCDVADGAYNSGTVTTNGDGWDAGPGDWLISLDSFGVIAADNFEDYADGDTLADTLNGGVGWAAAWQPTTEEATASANYLMLDNLREGVSSFPTAATTQPSWRGNYHGYTAAAVTDGISLHHRDTDLKDAGDVDGLDEDFETSTYNLTGVVFPWLTVDRANSNLPAGWGWTNNPLDAESVDFIADGSLFTDYFPAEGGYIDLIGSRADQLTARLRSRAFLVDHLSWDLVIRAAGSQRVSGDASHTVTVKVYHDASENPTTLVVNSSLVRAWNAGISSDTFAISLPRAGRMIIELSCTATVANIGPLIMQVTMNRT